MAINIRYRFSYSFGGIVDGQPQSGAYPIGPCSAEAVADNDPFDHVGHDRWPRPTPESHRYRRHTAAAPDGSLHSLNSRR